MLKQKNNIALAHYGLGIYASRIGNQNEATLHLKKALELSALDPYFLMELGHVYFSEGYYENAVTTLTNATAMVNDLDGKFHLARAQMELGKLHRAVTILKEIVKEKKDYSQAYYYLGEAYGKLEQLGEAHLNLGIYYRQKQDMKNTQFHLNRALKYLKDPEKRRQASKMLEQVYPKKGIRSREKRL
jgi:predicted Zn-dependent protease